MIATSHGKGVFCAVAGFFIWGVLPLYWRLLEAVAPLHLLAFRILLSLILLGAILALNRNFKWLTVFRDAKSGAVILFASLILCINWGLFIWAVNSGRIIETSLGYYINPLLSVVLGLVFFKERLSALQWTAFGLACLGVLILTLITGSLPWVSLVLAVCFGFYGVLKKKINLSSMESLAAETLAAAPLGIVLLLLRFDTAGGLRAVVDVQSLSYIAALGSAIMIPLAFSGLLTSLPLYFFGLGAKLLPLSSLGFFQFIAPTISFLIAIFVFGELFPLYHFAAFAFIWAAALLHIISLKRRTPA